MNIVAIIQARIQSTRLPNKIFKDIVGKPMLWHVVNRLRSANKINEIVLAIPNGQSDDRLEIFAQENNIKCFRGSESNVLSRYYGAAFIYGVDIIVRITSDCPLIDPRTTDMAIQTYVDSNVDYVYADTRSGLPRGFDTEVFNFKVLEKAYKEATKDYEKEHVTPYIYQHPELFSIKSVEIPQRLKRNFRLTVDTEEDLELVKNIYRYLYMGQIFGIEEIIELLDKHNELVKINAEIRQKEIA